MPTLKSINDLNRRTQPIQSALSAAMERVLRRGRHRHLFAGAGVLTTPCFPEMSDKEAGMVIGRINPWQTPCFP